MRKMALVAMGLLFAGDAPAQSYDKNSAARVVSLFASIGSQCSKIMNVNKPFVENFIRANYQIGQNINGKDKFEKMLGAELTRRNKEIAATGLDKWCMYQRGYMRDMGAEAFAD